MGDFSFPAVLRIAENRSRILAVIVAIVRDFDVAEYLFQETVIVILKSADDLDEEGALESARLGWRRFCGSFQRIETGCVPRLGISAMQHIFVKDSQGCTIA